MHPDPCDPTYPRRVFVARMKNGGSITMNVRMLREGEQLDYRAELQNQIDSGRVSSEGTYQVACPTDYSLNSKTFKVTMPIGLQIEVAR